MIKKLLFAGALALAFNSMNAQSVIFQDSFETYTDFAISNFGQWTQVDVDGGTTWAITDLEFDNMGYVGAGIIFNNSNATGSAVSNNMNARTGQKALAFFASGANGTEFPNDDWTISPKISLAGAAGSKVELYARGNQVYGPDQFNIAVSSTTNVADFVKVNATPIVPPSSGYTKYEFDLSAYDGQDVYIAINCVTNDGLYLFIDDFKVTAATLAVSDVNKKAVSIYPNPATEVLNLNVDSKINSADIYDLAGKLVKSASVADNKVNVKDLQNGTYVLKVNTEAGSTSHKFIKK